MLRWLTFLLLLITIPSRANLGDTVADSVKRYGKPVGFTEANEKTPFGTMVFTSGGYMLVVFLLKDTEVGARVSKADKSAFTDAELKTIMGADANSPWTVTESTDPTCQRWIRSDQATALYDKDNHVLIFTSPAMADALHRTTPVKPPAPVPVPARPPGDFAPAAPSNWNAVTNAPTPAQPATSN